MISKKNIAIFELVLMFISIISFAYLVSTNIPEFLQNPNQNKFIQFLEKPIFPLVSASSLTPSGCCLETNSGAICQELNLLDKSFCKQDLLGTGCSEIEQCQIGCCFSANSGVCSLNAPKEKCISFGGNWSSNAECKIPECQLGCCMTGNSAALTTDRECTLMSREYNLEKNFKQLDSKGSCESYKNLNNKGACVISSQSSFENTCAFTTKGECRGQFYDGYLCTAQELKTECTKTTKTTCLLNKDEIYFLDSCGNPANIYDASQANNDSYWEKIILKDASCQSGADCGNCDYSTGSVCSQYKFGKDAKPKYGNLVCKNLNCVTPTGVRKHGESWCVADYDTNFLSASPLGSRQYVAKCIEGEVTLEGCADFNQEICTQSTDTGYGFTEARCVMNEWRSCLAANDKPDYDLIESECKKYEQCTMLLDIPGKEIYSGLPTFDKDLPIEEQGSANEVGIGINENLALCVPKYNPGFQFWTNPDTINSQSQMSSGGSKEESDAICSLGSFSCVSHQNRKCELTEKNAGSVNSFFSESLCLSTGGISALSGDPHCENWQDQENWECNINGEKVQLDNSQLLNLMQAANDRCKAIGSCGTGINIDGKIGSTTGFTISRMLINSKGKNQNVSSENYTLSQDYLDKLSEVGLILPGTLKNSDLNSKSSNIELSDIPDSAELPTNEQGWVGNLDVGQVAAGKKNAQIAKTMGYISTGTTLVSAGMWAFEGAYSLLNTVTITPLYSGSAPIGSTLTAGEGGATILIEGGGVTESVSLSAGQTFPTASTGEQLAFVTKGSVSAKPPALSSNFWTGLKQGLGVAATAMAGSYAAGLIGKMIVKHNNWSPGRSSEFMEAISAIGAAIGTTIAEVVILMSAKGCSMFPPWGCIAGIIIAIAYALYESCIGNSYIENQYYIMKFNCESWQPPAQGDCSLCNNDVRPCTEYRCKSLGDNCHYFNDNGEPGYCTTFNNIWSAQIKPWDELITQGNKYAEIKSSSFKIQAIENEKVAAWTPITFGITTDKPAICKLDVVHTKTFDEMAYIMSSTINLDTNKIDGMHHLIALSPNVKLADFQAGATTPPLEEGVNDYFIRCRNFAGQVNEAEFTVRVDVASGPDLTPPEIKKFYPENNGYIKQNANSTEIYVYTNEPANCKFAQNYDENTYSDMQNNMSCLTDPKFASYGLWTCYAKLQNLSVGENKFFFKCKDQPDLEETDLLKRNENHQSTQYTLNVCNKPLNVSIILPMQHTLELENNTLEIALETTGCVNGGDATCSYSFGGTYADFKTTGGKIHRQVLDNLQNGNYSMNIKCEDEATNVANASISFTIERDEAAPKIVRIFSDMETFVIKTDESAECVFAKDDASIGCNVEFENTQPNLQGSLLSIPYSPGIYYIKCRDKNNNLPLGCTEIVRLTG